MNRTAISQGLLVAALATVLGCDKQDSAPKAEAQASAKDASANRAEDATENAGDEKVAKADNDHSACLYAASEDDAAQGKMPGCPHGGAGAADSAGTGKDGHFGAPFALESAQALASVVPGEGRTELPSDPVQVEGTVDAVCQKMGCWMVIKDGMVSARVLMKDHGFTVPMDARGKKARVEGTLASRTFTAAQVKHIEEDAGRDPAKVAGERTEYVLTASAVQIKS